MVSAVSDESARVPFKTTTTTPPPPLNTHITKSEYLQGLSVSGKCLWRVAVCSHIRRKVSCAAKGTNPLLIKRTQIHSEGNLVRMLDGIRQFGGIINLRILTGRYCHLACAVAKHCACVRLFTAVLYVRYSKCCIHLVQTQNILLINDLNTRNIIHNTTQQTHAHKSQHMVWNRRDKLTPVSVYVAPTPPVPLTAICGI
jgi:hypothetical protein